MELEMEDANADLQFGDAEDRGFGGSNVPDCSQSVADVESLPIAAKSDAVELPPVPANAVVKDAVVKDAVVKHVEKTEDEAGPVTKRLKQMSASEQQLRMLQLMTEVAEKCDFIERRLDRMESMQVDVQRHLRLQIDGWSPLGSEVWLQRKIRDEFEAYCRSHAGVSAGSVQFLWSLQCRMLIETVKRDFVSCRVHGPAADAEEALQLLKKLAIAVKVSKFFTPCSKIAACDGDIMVCMTQLAVESVYKEQIKERIAEIADERVKITWTEAEAKLLEL